MRIKWKSSHGICENVFVNLKCCTKHRDVLLSLSFMCEQWCKERILITELYRGWCIKAGEGWEKQNKTRIIDPSPQDTIFATWLHHLKLYALLTIGTMRTYLNDHSLIRKFSENLSLAVGPFIYLHRHWLIHVITTLLGWFCIECSFKLYDFNNGKSLSAWKVWRGMRKRDMEQL